MIRSAALLKREIFEVDTMNAINDRATSLGKEIFQKINRHKPSIFEKKYWSATMMEWSMRNPELKLNLFRFVDVLPTLRSSSSVVKHLKEYLGEVTKPLGILAHWSVTTHPRSPLALPTAIGARIGVSQMATQFIAGHDPKSSIASLRRLRGKQIAFTADLLGEYCLSEIEATAYLNRYLEALTVLGKSIHNWPEAKPIILGHPGESTPLCISVKLTALYSQCGPLNVEKSVSVLSERLSQIVRKAKEVNAIIYVDAEDSGNNEIIYKTFKNVFGNPEFRDFPYPGIVVQAYSTAAAGIIDDLLTFSRTRGSPIAVRLVKGAYWDHETISCEQNNWPCPLFKNKESTDANYERLSRVLMDNHKLIFPAFASHNIRSLSHACAYGESVGLTPKDFELQMLFGMADPIGLAFRDKGYLIRQYVPLGDMLPGMGYLIRRLLENTSNESFLRHTFFENDQIDDLLKEPCMKD